MGREVVPDLPSRESASGGGEAMNVTQCSADEECFANELSSSLVV